MTPRDTRALPKGSRVGPYRLIEPVGAGGLATVYRAVSDEGAVVALKLMHVTDDEQMHRSRREYEALRRMDHPNVVRVFGAGYHEGNPWLALELVDGPSLEDLIDSWRDQPPRERWRDAARVIRDLAAALDHVHSQGVFHRDIKPSNVLITQSGQAKLTDFGAVKAPDAFDTRLTMAGRLIGTVAFMAPEQITGEEVDARTDLYALGAVLYLALTGRRPVESDSIAGYLSKHLMDHATPPDELDPRVPVQLSRLAMRLMRKDREERPRSAAAVISFIDRMDQPRWLGLVGRSAELAALEDTLISLRKGEGSVISLVGVEGSGRSALLGELGARAHEDRIAVFHPRPERGSLIDEVRPLLLGTRPAVLLLDDADKIDVTEIRALSKMLRGRPSSLPLAIAYTAEGRVDMTSRSRDGLSPLQQVPAASPHSALIPIGPLQADAVVSLLRSMGMRRAEAVILGKRVFEVAGGLPKDILAQLDALLREGWLVRDRRGRPRLQGKAEAVRHEPLPLPEARRRALLQQVASLTADQRGLLEALAVIADDADASLLDAVVPGAARALASRGLGRLLNVRSEGFYEVANYRHREVRKVVYDAISTRRRRDLHVRAAEVLLSRHRRRQSAVAERVAGHYLAAGRDAEAFPLLVRAAQHAARRRETRKARVLAEKALVLQTRVGEQLDPVLCQNLRQQALAVAGEALLAAKNPAAARDALQAARQALQAHPEVDPSQERVTRGLLLEVTAQLGMALGDLGDATQALVYLESSLEQMEPGHRLRFATLRATADALRLLDRLDEARGTWARALSGARKLGSLGQQGAALLGLTQLELSIGQLEEARRNLKRAEELLRSARAARPLAITLNDKALLNLLDGRVGAALSAASEAHQLCRESNQPDLYPLALLNQAEAMLRLGDTEQARVAATDAHAHLQGREDVAPTDLAQLHFLAAQLLEPSAVDALPAFPAAPKEPAHLVARYHLFEADKLLREGDRRRSLTALSRARQAAADADWKGLTAQLDAMERKL